MNILSATNQVQGPAIQVQGLEKSYQELRVRAGRVDPRCCSLAGSGPRVDTRELAELDNPQLVRLYRVLSEILESDAGDDDPRLEEAAGQRPSTRVRR